MAINSGEYKEAVGLDSLYIADIVDSADGYTAATPEILAPVGTLKATPKTDSATSYYDDGAFDAIDSEGPTELELDVSNLPASMQAKLLGQEYDSTTGRVLDDADPSKAPYVAFGFRSKKSNGKYRYWWYEKVRFGRPSEEFTTQGEKVDPKPLTLKATAVKTIYKFTYPSDDVKGAKRVWGDEDTTSFSATSWFTAVQTPEGAADAPAAPGA